MAIAELIRHQVDGIVIPPNDPQALSEKGPYVFYGALPKKEPRTQTRHEHRAADTFSIQAWASRLCKRLSAPSRRRLES
ncbi:MAG: hypothetical protein R3C56_38980 [Pirellulaceae bacterium]